MGKVRRSRKPRSSLLPEKPRPNGEAKVGAVGSVKGDKGPEQRNEKPEAAQPKSSSMGNPFSNTKINLSALRTQLTPASSQEDDRMSFISKGSLRAGKEQLKKKDRMKLRRQMWMEKLAIIDRTRQRRKDRLKRIKTPVVGDLEPMMSALPELSEILKMSEEAGKRADKRRQTMGNKTRKSTMKAKQRQKLLNEERKRFQQVLELSAFKDDPFGAINKHLTVKLQQEESSS